MPHSIRELTPKKQAAILLFCALCLLFGCARPSDAPLTKTGFYFNTVISITIYDGDESLLDDCFEIAKRYEDLFSATIPSSEISSINEAKGTPVCVSDETVDLLKKGLSYCEMSDGGFDITIGALSSLWNFSENDGTLPDPSEIEAACSTVNYHNISLRGNEVCLENPDARIDLGGIAKGYIADRMKSYLNENGITEGMVNLGGNVLCLGEKADKTNYRIGIQMPFGEHGELAGILDVSDGTVVSSVVYERYIEVDGKRYHHILNPATGYPYENGLLSVTILCENSADGDGLSTACFSLGLDEGMALIERLPDTEAVFLTDDYRFHCSSGIGDVISFENRLLASETFHKKDYDLYDKE